MRFSDWSSDVCSSDRLLLPFALLLLAAWLDMNSKLRYTTLSTTTDCQNQELQCESFQNDTSRWRFSLPNVPVMSRTLTVRAVVVGTQCECREITDRKSTRLNSSH